MVAGKEIYLLLRKSCLARRFSKLGNRIFNLLLWKLLCAYHFFALGVVGRE